MSNATFILLALLLIGVAANVEEILNPPCDSRKF